MKGYAYLDADNTLNYRTWEYINYDNPSFFSDNSHYIIKSWMFDTEDKLRFLSMMRNFNDLKILPFNIDIFLKSINHHKSQRNENKV
jgi:hypothetical protein